MKKTIYYGGVNLAVAALLALAPLAALAVRNNPEDQGLWLHGDIEEQSKNLYDLTVWDALRSPAFWTFTFSSSLFGLVYSGISLFNQSILERQTGSYDLIFNGLAAVVILGIASWYVPLPSREVRKQTVPLSGKIGETSF